MPKMSLWPGFHPDTAGRAYSAGFMGLTYKGRGGEERRGEETAERRGGDVKGRDAEKGKGSRKREKGEGKERVILFPLQCSHFKPWARVTG